MNLDKVEHSIIGGGLRHVGFIMDGNGRWATMQGKDRMEGHVAGAKNLLNILEGSLEEKVEYVTVFALSHENTKRPKDELDALVKTMQLFLNFYEDFLVKNGIRFRVIGRYRELPEGMVRCVERLEEVTRGGGKMVFTVALNYSARNEVVDAVKRIVREGKDMEGLTWEELNGHLDTVGMPDLDLIVRTSGEHRLSNFLMLQGAYAEIYFTDVYWPDFGREEYKKALKSYYGRERRFGKTSEQVRGVQQERKV